MDDPDKIEIVSEGSEPECQRYSPHPWWSRALYASYALVPGTAAVFAAREGAWEAAAVGGGLAAVLIWKAVQRMR